jgi:hypothetical protein
MIRADCSPNQVSEAQMIFLKRDEISLLSMTMLEQNTSKFDPPKFAPQCWIDKLNVCSNPDTHYHHKFHPSYFAGALQKRSPNWYRPSMPAPSVISGQGRDWRTLLPRRSSVLARTTASAIRTQTKPHISLYCRFHFQARAEARRLLAAFASLAAIRNDDQGGLLPKPSCWSSNDTFSNPVKSCKPTPDSVLLPEVCVHGG